MSMQPKITLRGCVSVCWLYLLSITPMYMCEFAYIIHPPTCLIYFLPCFVRELNADMTFACLCFSFRLSILCPSIKIWLALDWNRIHLLSDCDVLPQVQQSEVTVEEKWKWCKATSSDTASNLVGEGGGSQQLLMEMWSEGWCMECTARLYEAQSWTGKWESGGRWQEKMKGSVDVWMEQRRRRIEGMLQLICWMLQMEHWRNGHDTSWVRILSINFSSRWNWLTMNGI